MRLSKKFKLGFFKNRRNNSHDVTDTRDYGIETKDELLSKSVPFYYGLLMIFLLISIWGLVTLINKQLPTPMLLKDEVTYPNAFNAERAQQYLKTITEFGPRVVGSSENEVLTVNYLKQEVNKIISQAHSNQSIELDIQVASGAFELDNPAGGRINVYRNVQNVVVKLHSRSGTNDSLLLNAHFDSVPTSPGAGDDGLSCATLLEIMTKLSRSPIRPLHNIIFLFNGAEETAMQASHGFISQHKWATEIKIFLNLDSIGSGGKYYMFQAGPTRPWIAAAYKEAPHPSAQTLYEENFQMNRFPSDSDFRIFRDFGGVNGLDSIFLRDQYRYHTKYDTFENIPLGSYQNAGDNILAITRNIMENPELSNSNTEEGNFVFFDYLCGFYVTYTMFTAYILNISIVISSICIFVVSLMDLKLGFNVNTIAYLSKVVTATLLGWIMAVVIVYSLATLYDIMGYSMSWYGNPWLVFGLYCFPTVAGVLLMVLAIAPNGTVSTKYKYDLLSENNTVGVKIFFDCVGYPGWVKSGTFFRFLQVMENLTPDLSCQIHLHVTRLIWTVILFTATVMGIRSSYILMIYVLFDTLAFVIIRYFLLRNYVHLWHGIYFLSIAVPTFFLMHLAFNMVLSYIPVSGRMGSGINPELIIGFLSTAFTLPIISPFVPFISFVRKPIHLVLSLGGIFLVCFIVIFTPLGFPYSGDPTAIAPQRFWISHSQRVFHGEGDVIDKQDSGFSLLNMDRNSPDSVRRYVQELKLKVDVRGDCEKYLSCGVPLPHPKMSQSISSSSWIPASKPIFSVPTQMTVNSKKVLDNIISFNLTISGPDRLSVFVSPKGNVTLRRTSLLQQLPAREGKWNGRPLYYIIYVAGKKIVPLDFTLNFEVPKEHKGATMDLAVSGIYVHEKINVHTKEFRKFLSQFPQWADLTVDLATYETWSL